MKPKHADAQLIASLGGAAKLARLLFPDNKFGVQRVNNWEIRGIPPRIRLDHPAIFAKAFDADGNLIATPTTEQQAA